MITSLVGKKYLNVTVSENEICIKTSKNEFNESEILLITQKLNEKFSEYETKINFE